MRRRLIPAAALCLMATACGSTVHLGAQGAGAGLDQSGLQTGTTTTGTDSSAVAPGADVTPTAGATDSPPPGASDEPGIDGSVPVGGGASSATSAGGPVVNYDVPATGSPVEVGIMYIPDLGAAAGQFGGSGRDDSDQRGYMKATADYMNAHGGLGGHKITLLYYGAQIAGAKTYDDSEQEMCSMMNEDHHAVASVIANITVDNLVAECMQKAKSMYVSEGGYFKTSADWKRLSYTVSDAEIDTDMLGRSLATYMISRGAAKRGDTVGVVDYDTPAFNSAMAQFTKVAKADGINVVSSSIHYAASTPDLATSIAQVQSAELAMKARGVTTVASLCSGCIGYFMKNAESQKYYPRYVLNSYDGVVAAPTAATGNQLRNSISMGWFPGTDVDLYKEPGLFASDPTYNTCRAINKKNTSLSSQSTLSISQRVCEALLMIQAAARGYGGNGISGTTLIQGLGKLGSTYSSGAAVRTSFSPTKHWAPSHYRSMHYDYNSAKFVYDSAPIPFS